MEANILPTMDGRQYRLALYDAEGNVVEGAQYTLVSEDTPTPGRQISLPGGPWFVHEVGATWSEDTSSEFLGGDPHYGGTLVCRPKPPDA